MRSLTRRTLFIAGREISLQIPADPEQLLNDAAEAGDDSDPYWGVLWDASLHMAKCVLESEWPPERSTLEIGCGAGLVGIAGLHAGLDVTFTDLVPEAVELAVSNAKANGFPNASGRPLSWRTDSPEHVDLILASDILYEAGEHEAILKFAARTLGPGGQFWIGDPGRQQAKSFLSMAGTLGWKLELKNGDLENRLVPAISDFQLIVLSR